MLLSVWDTGTGIPAHLLNKIFEPFFTTKPVGKGTGLGLSIIYGLVKDFGGSISARNRDEGGALFEIRLPITRRGDLAPNAPPTGTGPEAFPARNRNRFLEARILHGHFRSRFAR